MTVFIDKFGKEYELIYEEEQANKPNRIKPGTKASMLTVDEYLGYYYNDPENPDYKKRHVYKVTCDCGNVKMVKEDELNRTLSGKREIFSCGCYNKEFIRTHRRDMAANPWYKNKYHGEKDKKLTMHYWQMKGRCNDPSTIEYKNYGGRGIKLCEEWSNDKAMDNFGDWMTKEAGYDYSMGRDVSVNRANNDKGYGPNNCYLSYPVEQMNNMTKNTFIDWYGQQFSIAELGRFYRVNQRRIAEYYRKGKSIHEAIFGPIYTSRFERDKLIDESPNGLVVTPRAFTFSPFQFVDHSTIDYRDPRRNYPHPNHEQALNVIDYQNRETLKEAGNSVQPFRFTNSGSTDFLLYGKYQ